MIEQDFKKAAQKTFKTAAFLFFERVILRKKHSKYSVLKNLNGYQGRKYIQYYISSNRISLIYTFKIKKPNDFEWVFDEKMNYAIVIKELMNFLVHGLKKSWRNHKNLETYL